MGIIENHLGYELDMLAYTFDKLLLVEQLVEFQPPGGAGQRAHQNVLYPRPQPRRVLPRLRSRLTPSWLRR